MVVVVDGVVVVEGQQSSAELRPKLHARADNQRRPPGILLHVANAPRRASAPSYTQGREDWLTPFSLLCVDVFVVVLIAVAAAVLPAAVVVVRAAAVVVVRAAAALLAVC